ncbi:PHB depolymerase family esterase [Actinoplanes sp. ATCC 53533]|uniref:alpha/beta hydrolase family esterase n=1 Tax=Actinoplanes sp. ATCC 53533 TaxID=1288362 RepID=UPI0018F50285|nr:PHB depolymerase family esterase [Actinoplanes sp. ATCC 53533]
MTLHWRLASLLVPLVVLVGCTGGGQPAPVPTAPAGLPAGHSAHTLRAGGLDRTYRVYRPASLPADAAVPLVIVLHGAVGTGEQAEQAYGWDAEADRGGFVVAFPDGVGRTWNASPDCCGRAARDQVDDVGFMERLVSTLSGQAPIEPRRVYVTGMSNGALLAYRLACDSTVFAAIGAVAGTMINPCPRPAPISVIHIHGTTDRTIPYGGGPGRRDNGGTGRLPVKIDGPAVPDLLARWREVDSCPAPAESTAGSVTTSTAQCPNGRAVELITVAEAGHQWPGSAGPVPAAARLLHLDAPSTALNATGTIWRFFAAHPQR